MPHVIHVSVSVLSIIIFAIMAGLMIMSEMELNPVSRNYTAIAHTRVEVISFAIKTVITIASVMLNDVKWLSVVYLVFLALLAYMNIKWVRRDNARTARAASLPGCSCVCPFLALAALLLPSQDL